MKAWILHGAGDLRLTDVPAPSVANGEVLVRVKAAGVCASDIPRIFDEAGAYGYPLIPGHEFAGVVAEGFGDWLGKRVAAFPLIPCGHCRFCEAGEYEICENYNYIGSRRDGAFAEYVAVPAWNLAELPEGMSFETAALTEPAAVALHAARRAKGAASAAVFGAGIIGILTAKWLKAFGVRDIFIVGTREEQRPPFGVFLNIRKTSAEAVSERIRAATGGGADVCFEAAGAAFESCVNAARAGGAIVGVGNPKGDVTLPKSVYGALLRKQLTVTGSWNARYPDDWRESIAALDSGLIDIGDLRLLRFGFDELLAAADVMRSKTLVYSKLIIVM
jgi:L-iditol 2-dehydrogenase